MPISPERKALYPANWSTEIRPRILARAGNCCERCKVPNHVDVYRFVEDGDNLYQLPSGIVHDAENGQFVGFALIDDLPPGRMVYIVLTIAHVHDPDPANCADDNLAAWCQRCHNNHDRPMRMANAAITRRRKSGTPDLFDNGGLKP